MFNDSNIWSIIFSVLPALLYAFIIYMTTPYGSIKIKTAKLYGISGLLSIMFVLGSFIAFPNWHTELTLSSSLNLFLMAFFQIAFLEEICKFFSFKVLDMSRDGISHGDSSLGTMFYCMMSAVGFAVAENVTYVLRFGPEVLISRSFSSVICHMVCGLLMGYFIARGRQVPSGKRMSEIERYLKNKTLLRRGIYTTLGILAATIFHGTYDYILMDNSFSNQPEFIFFLLVAGVAITYKMGRFLSLSYLNKSLK
jgi:RsiW-degrading membrane proteinase PrsW (M82 family)